MKNLSLTLLFLAAIACAFPSCQTVDIGAELTKSEAVDLLEKTLADDAGGFAEYLEDLVQIYESTNDSCTLTGDTTIVHSSTGLTSYSYTSTYNYELNCTSLVPSTLIVTLNSTGNFDAPRLESTDSGSGVDTLSNLSSSFTEFLVNGVYSRIGTSISKVAQKGTFSYTMTLTLNNVQVNKSTKNIVGGTAEFNISGNSTGVGSTSFNYIGTVTFSSASTASVLLQGTNHTISIQ